MIILLGNGYKGLLVYVGYSIKSHFLLFLFDSISLKNVNNIIARGEKKVFFVQLTQVIIYPQNV